MLEKGRNLVYVFCLLIAPLFSVLYFLFSGSFWEGSDGDNTFKVVIAITTVIVFLFYFQSLLCKHFRLTINELVVWLVILVLTISYVLNGSSEELARTHFLRYLCLSIPSAVIGLEYSRKNVEDMTVFLQMAMLLLTFGFGAMILYSKINGVKLTYYQTTSYSLGFAYAINLLFRLFPFSGGVYCVKRWKLFNFRGSNFFYNILLLLQILLCLVSGGRGGFVLILVSTIVIFYFYLRLKGKRVKWKSLILYIICFVPLLCFLPQPIKDVIMQGGERVFSYWTSSGIDISETSGRDVVYEYSLELIAQRPWCGYGIWAYFDKTGGTYPHNLFLEFLLQRGILFLLLMLYILFRGGQKYVTMVKEENKHLLILPLVLLPGTRLLFSETYLEEGLFWFVAVYIYTYNLSSSVKVRIETS